MNPRRSFLSPPRYRRRRDPRRCRQRPQPARASANRRRDGVSRAADGLAAGARRQGRLVRSDSRASIACSSTPSPTAGCARRAASPTTTSTAARAATASRRATSRSSSACATRRRRSRSPIAFWAKYGPVIAESLKLADPKTDRQPASGAARGARSSAACTTRSATWRATASPDQPASGWRQRRSDLQGDGRQPIGNAHFVARIIAVNAPGARLLDRLHGNRRSVRLRRSLPWRGRRHGPLGARSA